MAKTKMPKVDWDAQPLGVTSDRELAERLGVHLQKVFYERTKRGIEAGGNYIGVNWDAQPLGEVPDTKIAKECGVSRERVRQVRAKRGIPSWQGENTKKTLAKLQGIENPENLSIKEISERIGTCFQVASDLCKKYGIKTKPNKFEIDWNNYDYVGKSDGQIAKDLGINEATVGRHRREAGIPAQQASKGGADLRIGIDWDTYPLGKMSDSAIARTVGVSRVTVLTARRVRGIPPFRESKDDS